MPRPNATRFRGTGLQNYKSNIHVGRDLNITTTRQDGEREEEREDPIVTHRKALLSSLEFTEMDAREENVKRAHAKTCQWFLQTSQYQAWLDMKRSRQHGGFLWVKGKPGAGKSTLMKVALTHTEQRLKSSGACTLFFFFNARGSDLEKSTLGLHRALLVQLLKACPEALEVLDSIRDDHIWGIESLKHTFERTLQFLKDQRLLCFIDALDECQEREVREMISWFEGLTCEYPLHVCFASRYFPNIAIRQGIQVLLENRQEHNQDIRCYIQDKLCFKDDQPLETEVQRQVQMKTSGIFMWVVLVINMLQREYDAGKKHKILERIRELPDDLHELFRDIFTRDSGLSQGLLLCLQWVLYAKHRLSPRQLYFATISGTEPEYLVQCHSQKMTDGDIERYILSTSRGLIEVTKPWGSFVQFIHESIKDFLLEEAGLRTLWQHLRTNLEGHGQEALKLCCWRYQTAIYPLLDESDFEIVDYHKVLDDQYPFLEHANDNVLYHTDQAEKHNINQNAFLGQFNTKIWSRLQDIFDLRWRRWYWPNISLLYILAVKGYPALIRMSLHDSCFEVEGGPYRAPVFVALATKSFAILESLLEVFIEARAGGDMSCFQRLWLRREHDKMIQKERMSDFVFSSERGVASHLAEFACNGMLELYLDLYGTGNTDIEQKDEHGWTALSYAARHGHISTIRLLIEHHASVNNFTKHGWTPLHLALSRGHLEAAELLVDKGANVNASCSGGMTCLFLASGCGHTETVRLLLDRGADIDATCYRMDTCLHSAAAFRRMETVKLLLDRKANIYARNFRGETPIYQVCKGGYNRATLSLFNRGADTDATRNDGTTCLSVASEHEHTEIIDLLLDGGADVNSTRYNQDSPLHLAAGFGYTRVAELLLHRGANVNARNLLGETPLHEACRGGNDTATLLLLDHGADANLESFAGITPLKAASLEGQTGIVSLLVNHGAEIEK